MKYVQVLTKRYDNSKVILIYETDIEDLKKGEMVYVEGAQQGTKPVLSEVIRYIKEEYLDEDIKEFKKVIGRAPEELQKKSLLKRIFSRK
ncbi:hypothetical protein [Geobacillus phage GR1]|nr:hypothetical protein [Geobacillus phage GR1]